MEPLRRLWRHDRSWRWFLPAFLVLLAVAVGPSVGLRSHLATTGPRLLLIPLVLAMLAIGRRQLDGPRERRFWGWLVVAFSCWTVASWWVAFTSVPEREPLAQLVVDTLHGAYTLAWLLALATAPHHDDTASGSTAVPSSPLRTAATILLIAGLTVYFTVIPWRLQPDVSVSTLPSLTLYIVLDLIVVALLARAWVLSESPRWRGLYALLGVAALGFSLGDMASAMDAAGRFDLRPGLVSGLLGTLPYLPLVLAARLRHLPAGRSDRRAAEQTLPKRTPSPIPVAALVLPAVHILGHRWALFDPLAQAPRERWVLVCLIVLGILASIENLWLRRAARRADQAMDEARELRLAKAVAERSQRAKSQFLASISHEIRTPMAGIVGLSGILLDGSLPDKGRRYAELLQTSAHGLLHTVDQLLEYSKIEAGRLSLVSTPFMLRELVETLVDELADQAQTKGLTLRYSVTDTVPNALVGDARRLRQILGELLSNALKFTESGSAGLTIDVAPPDAGSPDAAVPLSRIVLCFVVDDTGIGISDELQGRLFHPFAQEDPSASRRFGGTGLGLAICHRIIRALGGSITAEHHVDEGARFRVEIPYLLRTPTKGAS